MKAMEGGGGSRGYETVDVSGLEGGLRGAAESGSAKTERRLFYLATVLLLLALLLSMPGAPPAGQGAPQEAAAPGRMNASGPDFCLAEDDSWTLPGDTPPPPPAPPPILFVNCRVWTGGPAGLLEGASLLVSGGKVAGIGEGLVAPPGAERVDCGGAWVTPGIVDIHSHLGVFPYPGDWAANGDGNEYGASGPGNGGIMNMVRALDAIDPEDPAIQQIRSGGVTTSQVLPGSGNMMGGESVAVKMTGGPDCVGCTVKSMVIPEFRGLKMACGENTKRSEKLAGGFWPNTRMGSAYKMREQFFAAKKYMQAQDDWDAACAAGNKQEVRRPKDLSLDSLVALLRGEAKLHNHCYQVHDMEMMIRLSHEFGFKIAAFHHTLESYKILPELIKEGIAAATWPDDWVGKAEGYDTSFHTPAWTVAAGAMLVLKSDHPVTDAKALMYSGARAVHYGLPQDEALKALTINAATVLGLDHRVGSLEIGKDADLVVWDRHPLSLGAAPRSVFIEGALKHSGAPLAVPPPFGDPQIEENAAAFSLTGPCDTAGTEGGLVDLVTYSVRAATIFGTEEGTIYDGLVVVLDGIVSCVGTVAQCAAVDAQVPAAEKYVTNGEMWAGLVSAGDGIGLFEMGDSVTHDGTAHGSTDEMLDLHAIQGMRTGGRHTWEAFRGAFSVAVTPPEGRGGLIKGVSGAWWVTPQEVSWETAVLQRGVALHVALGNGQKGAGLTGSISGQLAMIKQLLTRDPSGVESLEAVRNGTWPLVVHVHQADAIAALLRLRDEVAPTVRLTVFGGAEAHLVAGKLAAADVPVVLAPPRAVPRSEFDHDRAVGGEESAAQKLHAAGVFVGMAGAAGPPTNLRWEAGLAVSAGVPRGAAMEMVTTNVAQAFGLQGNVGRIAVGQRAHFAVYSSDPLAIDSEVMLVGVGKTLSCRPPATPWDLPWAPDTHPRPAGFDWTHLG